jgi:hypothetical protein
MAKLSADNAVPPGLNIVVDVPPIDTQRWSPKRKALVVNAVRSGVISLEEACRLYQLSAEEFLAWQRAIETHGVPGLRVTRLRMYRRTPSCPPPEPDDSAL